MTRSNLNQTEAAAHIGIGYWYFNKILSGVRLPGRDVAVQIEAKTGIPVRAWASSRVDEDAPVTATHGRK
jgi:hypothetical protein